jgi:hypothetical protein
LSYGTGAICISVRTALYCIFSLLTNTKKKEAANGRLLSSGR